MRNLLVISFGLLVWLDPVSLHAGQKSKSVSFIRDVAPILKKNCFSCHDANMRKGKLDMTTWESFRKGGRNDDPIVPGKPKESYLIDVLTTTSKRRMPPADTGKPLPKQQIEIIAAWIAQGAKLDPGIDPKADLREVLLERWEPPALLASYPRPVVITAVAFTSDGSRILTGGFHELTVWEAKTGRLLQRIHTRAERTHDIEVLDANTIVVAGGRPGQEGDVRVYRLDGKSKPQAGVAVLDGVHDPSVLVKHLLRSSDTIFSVDVSDNGQLLAAAGCDRLVRIWDISKGFANPVLKQSFENHADWVLSVNFSADGTRLVTASRDKSSKVWVIPTKESLVTFSGHGGYVFGALMSGDGNQGISAGADGNIRWWDAKAKSKSLGKQVRSAGGHRGPIYDLAEWRQKDKHLLATAGEDGTARLWDAKTGKALRTLSGAKQALYAVAFSPDGKLVAAGGLEGKIYVWNTADGKLLKEFHASPNYRPQATTAGPAPR